MEVAACFVLLLIPCLAEALGGTKDVSLMITRQNTGDVFTPEGIGSCQPESCVGLSSGTAAALPGGDLCNCQCHSHLPAFREDLRICVDDIHECVLAPFVGGSTSQQIPFVFLPLKGQIIHPSKEISFTGIQTPVCAVSGAKFLTEAGWVELRNPVDTDVPFRLYRDEGRTFLQWVGESELRTKMSGRLVLVYLMCRELATTESVTTSSRHTLFSPCVAFRVVGTPTKYLNNVSEVVFFPDAHSTSSSSEHLSVSEYVAIGICSLLLGLIYVASVFLYLHLRKRNKNPMKKTSEDQNLSTAEEGVVKNNPLLSMVAHFQPPDTVYSDSTGSDTDMSPDIIQHNDDRKKSTQITSALIHPHYQRQTTALIETNNFNQDLPSIEKLPEENVSIVETLESRDERMDSFKALSGTVRRKLYFNPAYFEPQLLLAPPPAALEFLAKIREVITIAKQKMEAKRFTPSLLGIPEEEPSAVAAAETPLISLKRENSRRRTCTGCPGCEPQALGRLAALPSTVACQSCSDSKQRSIRKWLEDVPVLKEASTGSTKRLRSPARSLPPDRPKSKPKAPPPPMSLPPPDMIQEAMAVEAPALKKQMKAVIDEFAQRSKAPDYETDSLERTRGGYCTPTEYADLSSQPSPTLSGALPMDEEMTMRNAIFNKRTGNMTISKINVDEVLNGDEDDDHDYELIVLKKGSLKSRQSFYKLPELLQRTNGYSLVSEVYVNNGYNYSSAPSSPSESNCSTLEKRTLKLRCDDSNPEQEQPVGKLLIEVADCPDNYLPVEDSDSFEPDTLDRKPSKLKISRCKAEDELFADSLERPAQILLRTNGSFKKSPVTPTPPISNFTRGFGSLREIYEAKTKAAQKIVNDEGRLLTLEERHSKRQRRLTAPSIPPDLIPPPPIRQEPIYEQPKAPRKVALELKPPLPPKNGSGRGASRNTAGSTAGTPAKPEEEGYQSNDSHKESESEGSLDDGHSESGAESVETHSVFFGSFRKPGQTQYFAFGSLDSGVDAGPNNDLKSIGLHEFANKSILFTNG